MSFTSVYRFLTITFDKNVDIYIDSVFTLRKEEFGDIVLNQLQKTVLLMSIDQHCVDHLTIMDNMRQGIGLEAAGQRDPLIQYKRMAFQMFNELTARIGSTVARSIFRLAIGSAPDSFKGNKVNTKSKSLSSKNYNNLNSNGVRTSNIETDPNRKLSRQERRRIERLSKKKK